MKNQWIGEGSQGRPTIRAITHHLLVDIIPILLMLLAMAYGMAVVSSNLTAKPLYSDTDTQTEKVS